MPDRPGSPTNDPPPPTLGYGVAYPKAGPARVARKAVGVLMTMIGLVLAAAAATSAVLPPRDVRVSAVVGAVALLFVVGGPVLFAKK